MVALVRRIVLWRMRRVFHGFFVRGIERLERVGGGPLLACANHTNYWDGWVALVLTGLMPGRAGYVMQEERHLKRYAFLRWVGSFGVELGNSRAAVAGVRHALGVLARPGACLWLFPQGRIEHPCAPIRVRGGAAYLAEKSGARTLPVAIAYEWSTEALPGIYVGIGEPLPPGGGDAALERALEGLMGEVREAVCARRFEEFAPVLPVGMSVHRRWDQLRHAMRGGGAPFDPRTP
jgi:1-acyl-sn-glycerol-3-phosphate acyltransferase